MSRQTDFSERRIANEQLGSAPGVRCKDEPVLKERSITMDQKGNNAMPSEVADGLSRRDFFATTSKKALVGAAAVFLGLGMAKPEKAIACGECSGCSGCSGCSHGCTSGCGTACENGCSSCTNCAGDCTSACTGECVACTSTSSGEQ